MKKVLALGGAGHMGQKAVTTLLASKKLGQIIIADKDIDLANKFAESLKDHRVLTARIDILDSNALVKLMKEVDVVMNTVGPFQRFGVPVVKATIAAGRHYIDINDDYQPTKAVLELDDEAKKAGITVIVGMGAGPGVDNILARYAADQLDETEYIQTAWGIAGGIRRPGTAFTKELFELLKTEAGVGAIEHLVYCATWKIPLYRDGKYVEVLPLQDGEEVSFPNGKAFFYYIGHPEPVTLPRFIKGIKGACNLCGMEQEELDTAIALGVRIRDKQITFEEAVAMFAEETFKRLQQRPPYPQDTGPLKWGIAASALGKKDGKKIRYTCGPRGAPRGDMIGVTGVSLAIGVEMLINGEIDKKGVLAPEGCIDPWPFFKRYINYWDFDNKKYWIPRPDTLEKALWHVVEEL